MPCYQNLNNVLGYVFCLYLLFIFNCIIIFMFKMTSQGNSAAQEVVHKRKNCLPNVISSLQNEFQANKILDNLKLCIEFLPTIHIADVDRELLQWIIPVLSKTIKKLYDDTALLVDTVDDDFILTMVKDNLKRVYDFLNILKTILEILLNNSEVYLCDIKSVPVEAAYIILLTFEYCKNSSETYKNAFKMELLDIFRISQEVHQLFLRLLESCIVLKNVSENVNDSKILKEVLDTICEISSALSDLNVKSMITNWKAYKGILQKFQDNLEEIVDLKQPVNYLMNEIIKNLSLLSSLDFAAPSFDSTVTRTINIITFLISVALNIFHVFWNILQKISEELLIFWYSIYRFSPEYFQSRDYPESVVNSIRSIFASIEPFIFRLSNDPTFSKIIINLNMDYEMLALGMINFLSTYLKGIIENNSVISDFRIDTVLERIFCYIRACFTELFWDSKLFDKLVFNISAAVIIYNESYSKIECILLNNILQEDIFPALLALEIWSVLLNNSTTQLCTDTVNVLADKYEELNFGLCTYRLEDVFLKHMIQRIFRILPYNAKTEVIEKLVMNRNTSRLKIISLHGFPSHQKHLIENVCADTVEKINEIGSDTFTLNDLISIGENFEILSSANFRNLRLNISNLVNAVTSVWEPTHTSFNNSVLEYFIIKLCKITRTLILEFNTKQLLTILNQLKVLSSHDPFKLHICYILLGLSDKNTNDFGQDGYKIYAILPNIFYPNLLNSSNIIKQNALEVIDSFFKKNKHDFVRDIMRASMEIQGELSNYLHKNIANKNTDNEYLNMLDNLKYMHKCVEFKEEISQANKKIKISCTRKTDPISVKNVQMMNPRNTHAKIDEEEFDNASEVIAAIRSDVKCLVNLLKTESLSKKNVSDLKLLTNQLLSLM